MPRWRLLICPVALAPLAQAVDGVVEIDQARAEAGGVTATGAPGFPVTLGVPGSYRLTSSLDWTRSPSSPNATGTRIESTDVTLDLDGFSRVGPASRTGALPTACTPGRSGDGICGAGERIRMRNGIIRGAGQDGVFIQAGTSTVEDLRISHCGSRRVFLGHGRIADNVAERNTGSGSMGSGIIARNVVWTNGGGGISGLDGSDCQAVGNDVASSQELGISGASACGENVIRNNSGFIGEPPQTSGGLQIAPNVCGSDMICP